MSLDQLSDEELERLADCLVYDYPPADEVEAVAAQSALKELIRRGATAPAHLWGPACCDTTYATAFR